MRKKLVSNIFFIMAAEENIKIKKEQQINLFLSISNIGQTLEEKTDNFEQ